MNVLGRLQSHGIVLSEPPAPVAAYVPVVRSGHRLHVSGPGPMVDGVPVVRGKLGLDLDVAEGAEAARLAARNAIAADFDQQHLVVTGASSLLFGGFGAYGRHARAAVGTNSLPLGIPVEIELIVEAST